MMVRLWVTLAHLNWSNKRPVNGQCGLFQPERAQLVRDDDARHKCRTTRTLPSLRRTTDVIRVSSALSSVAGNVVKNLLRNN
jgi:hypothetical protein